MDVAADAGLYSEECCCGMQFTVMGGVSLRVLLRRMEPYDEARTKK